jgi:hypothetical protein
MEQVLDVYKRPDDPRYPVVCMDESPRQLIGETRCPVPARPGHCARVDYEYVRYGVCNVFMAVEPLGGERLVCATERKTKRDWARFLQNIESLYPDAMRITLVTDDLNTHVPGSLHESFDPPLAKALWGRFEFIYTPKRGSWLNMAEIELNVLHRQCLNRRIDSIDLMRNEVAAWEASRNNKNAVMDLHFSIADARVKLKRLYPTYDA